ncbi:arylamine N-acetyltransferase [Nocardiopsis sp. HUAS JQ3]|uniref:arylamine N-acetyltransferase n=1 Tax=Nocardiopsis sp. HUAS JQ3 TaxID=3061629 RepID=UPI0023AA1042|nr:arylamine N-acetyltransferase [Nocardiopsis sp. HUAS JQ3]WDZ92338.1 arylamine N-acetyltransferase [Nocardiopsis sp. HUAS JQ3]
MGLSGDLPPVLTSHPRSPFLGRLMAQRIGPGAQHTLTDTTLTTAAPDGTRTEREVPVEEVGRVLREVFGIGLDQDERAVVEKRLREFTAM